MTALLLVHGRGMEMPGDIGRTEAAVRSYVEGKKREWLAGLTKGMVLAGQAPAAAETVYFPFYGNILADLISAHEAAGGRSPDLESVTIPAAASRAADNMALDAAAELGFHPSRRLVRTDPKLVKQVVEVERAQAEGQEAGWSDLLKPRGLFTRLGRNVGQGRLRSLC